MISIESMRNLCHDENIVMTKHAYKRLKERGISIDDVKHAVLTCEIISQYDDDKPYPSCLLIGKAKDGEYIHIIANIDADFLYIITSYYPDKMVWEHDLKTRRRQ
jgi:hypothetical protein